jgi:Uma2 family endonuclease
MSVAMEEGPRRHRITVDEYHRMAEVGLLAPDARVELIDGEIIEMPPIGNPHAGTVDLLNRLIGRALGDLAIVRCQGPVQLGNYSEPQPDFALLSPRDDFYMHRRPTPEDTLLAIEVSDTSLRFDLHTKMSLYARHRIPEFWVLDVQHVDRKRLHVFRHPTDIGYGEAFWTEKPGSMPITTVPGVEVDLSSVFR